MTNDVRSPEDETLQLARLQQYFTALIPLTCFFVLLYGGGGLLLHSRMLLLNSGIALLLAGAVLLARRLAGQGRLAAGASTVGYGLLAVAASNVLVFPFLYPTLVLVCVMAVSTVLPYLKGPPLRRFLATSYAVILENAAVGIWLARPLPELPWGLGRFIGLSTTASGAFLTLLLLWQFSSRLRVSLERERAAREEAQATGQEYRHLAAAIPQQVWTANPDGNLNFVNQRVLDYFQLPESTVLGGSWLRVIHPDDRPGCADRWSHCLATGESYEVEFRLRRSDGTYRWHLGRALAMRDAAGRIVQWFGTNTDIHDQKEIQKALRASEERLREERRALQESEERAREADRRKDEFLAMLGHELRNPLAPILTTLDLLRARQQGELSREHAIIDRQVRHVTRLVDDLLDVSRITRGKIQLKKEPIELSLAVDRAVEIVRPLIEQRQHEVRVELPGEGLWVEADPVRLSQVIANLLTNAAKYTDPGGRITITGAEDGGWAVVKVADTGSGIPDELLPHLFELFVQGARSLDRSQGGLGIGLTLVKMLVELHGGSVAASSEGTGKGSEFQVRLPVLRKPASAARPRSAAAARPSADQCRILVVDDNVDAAEVLAECLQLSGHEVRVANDGPVALDVAAEFEPEVVLLDIGLPTMDGFEVARRLRTRHGSAALIALTGYGQESDRQRARDAGFDEHMVKPVELEALTATLARIARQRDLPSSRPTPAPGAGADLALPRVP